LRPVKLAIPFVGGMDSGPPLRFAPAVPVPGTIEAATGLASHLLRSPPSSMTAMRGCGENGLFTASQAGTSVTMVRRRDVQFVLRKIE
jgi:hypothetical protein